MVSIPNASASTSEAPAVKLPPAPSAADFLPVDKADVDVGRLLFFDPILSGNRNISCATCHHPAFGTSDGLSLGIGEGGVGLGPDRKPGTGRSRILKRVPRNSQALWNLGARDIHTLFHDGRLSVEDLYGNGFNSPAEEWLPEGLDSILAAQALFPLVAQFEMAGNLNENEIIGAVHDRIDAAWPLLVARIRAIDPYVDHFKNTKAHIRQAGDISIVDIGNAIGAFVNQQWRSINSPFDQYLRGDTSALTSEQKEGMELFYGTAGCSGCHSGMWLSDQQFHALALPSFGPGRTRRWNLMARDLGRMAETDALEDAYRFRTPMLRNVAKTAPYGHNGAYPTLDGIIRHHLNPRVMSAAWTPSMAALPDVPWLAANDFLVQQDEREMQRQRAALSINPPALDDAHISALIAFMHALTDAGAQQVDIPETVPSGLVVDRTLLSLDNEDILHPGSPDASLEEKLND